MSPQILQPGPDHPITVTPTPGRVTVTLGDTVLADSRRALTLREANYPPVQYVPRADVEMGLLDPSDHTTHCPYKGDASYFDVRAAGDAGAGAVWSYETPHAAVAGIAEHLAFYPDRVQVTVHPD